MRKSIYNKKVVMAYLNEDFDLFGEYLEKRDPVALVLDAIEKGNFNRDAARLANISESEFYLWQQEKISLNKVNPYYKLEFSESVSRAKARRINFHLTKIREASDKDWRASAWMLEKIEPKIYGKNTQIGFNFQPPRITIATQEIPERTEEQKEKDKVYASGSEDVQKFKEVMEEIKRDLEEKENQDYS